MFFDETSFAVELFIKSPSSSSCCHSADSLTSAMVLANSPSMSNRAAVKYCEKIRDIYWSFPPGQKPSKKAMCPPRAVTTIATCDDFSAASIGIAVRLKVRKLV